MKYYSLLKTINKAQPELLDMPVIALGLKPSVLEQLDKNKEVKNGRIRQKFETIRELLAYGKSQLMSLMSLSKPAYTVLKDNIYHIEERLAKLGLRFSDTEFTIGDVRLSEINMSDSSRKFLTRIAGDKIKTLDDIIIYNYEKIENQLHEGERTSLTGLEKAIGRYGLRIEGSKYRYSSNESFPLDDYIAYLPETFVEGRLEDKNKKLKRMVSKKVDLTNLSLEELLKTEIDTLYEKHSRTVIVLKDSGVSTIGELINYSEEKLRRQLGTVAISQLQDKLALLNLKMKDSSVKVVNGQVIRRGRNDVICGLVQTKAPKPCDVTKLNPIQREKFLNTQIKDFGFSGFILEKLLDSEKYHTINDVLKTPREQLLKDTSQYVVQTLTRAFALYNLKLNKYNSSKREKYFSYNTIIGGYNFEGMNETQRSEFLKKPLRELGFTEYSMELFAKVDKNIKSMQDVLNYSRENYLNAGLGENDYQALRKALNFCQFNVIKTIEKEESLKFLVPIETLSKEEREALMNRSVSDLMLPKGRDTQLINAGILTIKDLVSKNSNYYLDTVKLDSNTLHLIRTRLKACGLKLEGAKDLINSRTTHKTTWTKRDISKDELLPENRHILEAKPIDSLGLKVVIAEKLKQGNITTIGQLLALKRSEVTRLLKNHNQMMMICENLESLCLELKGREVREGKVENKKVQRDARIIRTITEEDLKPENRELLLKKPIESLGLKELLVEKLKAKNVLTIKDLCTISKTELGKHLSFYHPYVKDVYSAMDFAGVTVGFLSEKKRKPKTIKYTKRNITEEDLKPENKQKLLEKSVRDLGVRECIANKLEQNGILTIGELIKLKTNYLQRKIVYSPIYVKEVKQSLLDIGLVFGGTSSSVDDKDGKDKKIKDIAFKKNIDAEDLKPENRERLLSKPIEDLGLKIIIVEKLKKNNVNTIKDLCALTPTKLRCDILKYYTPQYKEISSALDSVGLHIENARRGKKSFQNQVDLTTLIEEDRETLLSRPVSDLGIRLQSIEKLNNQNIKTIGELVALSPTELNVGVLKSYNVAYKEIIERLNVLGLNLQVKEGTSKSFAVKKSKFEELKNISETEKLALDIESLALSKAINEALKNNGIVKVSDLVEHSYSELKNSILNSNQTIIVSRRLKEFGLILKSAYDIRGRKSLKSAENQSENAQKIMGKQQEKLEFVTMDDVVKPVEKSEQITAVQQKPNIQKSQKLNYELDLKPEQIKVLDDVRRCLREKGMWTLYDLDRLYFISCSKEMEAIKEIAREYFDDRFNSLILDAKNEAGLEAGIKKLDKETNLFETIIQQKQTELRASDDTLISKKLEMTSAMRKKIFGTIDKYHHNPYDFSQTKDIKSRNNFLDEEFNNF